MKANSKASFRLLKKHIIRLITIMAIVVVSIGFMSGVGEVEGKIKVSANEIYLSKNVADLYIKSNSNFSVQDISFIEEQFGAENVLKSFSFEQKNQNSNDITRIHSYDLSNNSLNNLELIEGRMPTSSTEILAEVETNFLKNYSIGDTVTVEYSQIIPFLPDVEYTVVGVVLHPYYIYKDQELSFQYKNEKGENDGLDSVLFLNNNALPSLISNVSNDIYVAFENRDYFEETFSKEYNNVVSNNKTILNDYFSNKSNDNEKATVLTLNENIGIYSMVQYAEKVGIISIVFVVFFLLVTLLVGYSTMSRLLSEERRQIACQKTLGYSNIKIISKYLMFVAIAGVCGALVAFPVGYGLTYIVHSAFGLKYFIPSFPHSIKFVYFIITTAIVLISTLLMTFATGMKSVNKKPSILLTPKAPKSGKKVIIEKIGFIWNKLSFKYKSTLRNVLLFKSRFIMTVVSIIGSTVLVFCGLGIMDCATNIPGGEALKTIAIVLVVFSAVLCALVIYNITNINVSERNREIATLMVLGYHNKEVTGYIFREIYIMSAIGALLGLPVGVGFIQFVFGLINFGTIADITWHTYLLTPIIAMSFSVLSTLLLKKTITKTDMNASLKTLE